jgi:phospholipase C
MLKALACAALFVAACSSSAPNTSGNTDVACRPLTVTSAHRTAPWNGTVFVVVMENHSRSDILGNADAPYINGLAQANAVAGGYHDDYVHPSEPNYLWMVAGENFGILDDGDPGASNHTGSRAHLADQLEQAGLTWRAYAEGMGTPCNLTSAGAYAVKHVPFAFFDDVDGWNGSGFDPSPRCQEHLVDYSHLGTDIAAGTVPDYVFITPSLEDDMHDGSVAQADAWAAREVPKILASPSYQNGGVLFLLWDEGSNDADDPPFIVASPNGKHGLVSTSPFDTSSFLLTVESIFGVDALPCAAHPGAAAPMSELFSTPLPTAR